MNEMCDVYLGAEGTFFSSVHLIPKWTTNGSSTAAMRARMNELYLLAPRNDIYISIPFQICIMVCGMMALLQNAIRRYKQTKRTQAKTKNKIKNTTKPYNMHI